MAHGHKNGKIYKTHDINYVRRSHKYQYKKVHNTDKMCAQICVRSS